MSSYIYVYINIYMNASSVTWNLQFTAVREPSSRGSRSSTSCSTSWRWNIVIGVRQEDKLENIPQSITNYKMISCSEFVNISELWVAVGNFCFSSLLRQNEICRLMNNLVWTNIFSVLRHDHVLYLKNVFDLKCCNSIKQQLIINATHKYCSNQLTV